MNISEIEKRFAEKYKQAYKNILPDDVLEQGNSWFVDFLRSEISALLDKLKIDNKYIEQHHGGGNGKRLLIQATEEFNNRINKAKE